MQGALQFFVGIFGGLLLSLIDANPVVKLGVSMTALTVLGAYLVSRLDVNLDLSKMD